MVLSLEFELRSGIKKKESFPSQRATSVIDKEGGLVGDRIERISLEWRLVSMNGAK